MNATTQRLREIQALNQSAHEAQLQATAARTQRMIKAFAPVLTAFTELGNLPTVYKRSAFGPAPESPLLFTELFTFTPISLETRPHLTHPAFKAYATHAGFATDYSGGFALVVIINGERRVRTAEQIVESLIEFAAKVILSETPKEN